MTSKQLWNYNNMLFTLQKIHKSYQSASQIRKHSKKEWGLDFDEAIEAAYENIQMEAKSATKGVKKL